MQIVTTVTSMENLPVDGIRKYEPDFMEYPGS
jgi:hypothetical protein